MLHIKQIIIITFFILFFNSVHAADNWVGDLTESPNLDAINFPGQDCNPDVICGDNSDIAQCYTNASLTPPSSPATSNTDYTASYDGGFIINSYATADSTAPYCDNNGAFWCDRNSSCYTTDRRDTTCLANLFTATSCGSCRSGYLDCDTDATPCEIQINGGCGFSTGTFASICLVVGSGGDGNCTASGNSDCNNDDSDNNERTCNGGSDGCEIISGASCGVGTGTLESAVCVNSTSGNCTNAARLDCNNDDADNNEDTGNGLIDGLEILIGGSCSVGSLSGTYQNYCSGGLGVCDVDKSYFETGTFTEYLTNSTEKALLWFKNWNPTGWLINTTNINNETWGVNNDSCMVLKDGTEVCDASDIGGGETIWDRTGTDVTLQNVNDKWATGTSSTDANVRNLMYVNLNNLQPILKLEQDNAGGDSVIQFYFTGGTSIYAGLDTTDDNFKISSTTSGLGSNDIMKLDTTDLSIDIANNLTAPDSLIANQLCIGAGVDCKDDWLYVGNTSWNKSYADLLYDPIGSGGDNASWNESYANTLYNNYTEIFAISATNNIDEVCVSYPLTNMSFNRTTNGTLGQAGMSLTSRETNMKIYDAITNEFIANCSTEGEPNPISCTVEFTSDISKFLISLEATGLNQCVATSDSKGTWDEAESASFGAGSYLKLEYDVIDDYRFISWDKDYNDLINIPQFLSNFTNDLGIGGDNASWNETYADTLYPSKTDFENNATAINLNLTEIWANFANYLESTSIYSILSGNMSLAYDNDSRIEGLINNSWNETKADEKYYLDSNPLNYTNTTLTNESPIGLENDVISLIECADTQIYAYNSSYGGWECQAKSSSGGGTVTSVSGDGDYVLGTVTSSGSFTFNETRLNSTCQALSLNEAEADALYYIQSTVNSLISGNASITLASAYTNDTSTLALAYANDSDTTYSAGNGISLSTTTFSVAGNTALSQDSDGLSVTNDAIGDTQLEYNTGQALTTTSDVIFNSVNATGTIINNSGIFFDNGFSIESGS